MEYASFSTAKLGEITDEHYLDASWFKCGRGARLSVSRLRDRLGPDFAVAGIGRRLRCERCGARGAVVTFLNPSQRSGNLVRLYRKPPA